VRRENRPRSLLYGGGIAPMAHRTPTGIHPPSESHDPRRQDEREERDYGTPRGAPMRDGAAILPPGEPARSG
jgi:hypothetical protein